jgi:tetratricopeptide (TPR) repeat protein
MARKNGALASTAAWSAPRAAVLVAVLAAWTVQLSAWASSAQTGRRVRLNEGIIAFNQRDYAGARRIFAELVDADDKDAAALYWLGLCQLQLNDYIGAEQSLSRTVDLAPQQVEVELDRAIALVGVERFAEAHTALQKFMESQRGDPQTRQLGNFFLGVIDYKTGRLDEALAAFDAAAAGPEDPDLRANIAWYRGWIFVEQRRFEEATAAFEDVARLSTSVDQQTRSSTLAEQIGSGDLSAVEPAASQFDFRMDLGFYYDTNVILLGDDTSLPVDLATDENFRFGLGTDFRYVQPLGRDWLVGLGGGTFNSWHASLQEFNVQTYGGRTFVNYFPGRALTLGLEYAYEYSLVDNEAFLSRQRITPSLRLAEHFHEDGTTATATTLFYSFEPRNYHEEITDPRTDRDGDYHSAGVAQSINFLQPRLDREDPRWLSALIGYRWQDESTTGTDFDMIGNELSARINVPMAYDLEMELAGEWTWEDYKNPNSQDRRRRKRQDFVQRYTWSLGREWQLDRRTSVAVQGLIAWTFDDSNVRNNLGEAIYSYDRVIYGLTLSFFFH